MSENSENKNVLDRLDLETTGSLKSKGRVTLPSFAGYHKSGGSMIDFLDRPGFLATHATFLSDLSLTLILLSAILFTIGWQLARRKHFEAHRWVQTAAAILNAIVVLGVMIYSFAVHILPGLPVKFFEGSYGITTVHAFVGLIGLVLGIFVVLRANNLVPDRLRFKNYKLFMRASYLIYMLATFTGIIVYIEAFIIGI